MTAVTLQLPAEVVDELAMPYEGVRDLHGMTVAIEGVNLAASVVTLAALRAYARQFVEAIRRWRLRDRRASVTMTVRGPGIDLRIDLPRNVSSADLLDQLHVLLSDDGGPPRDQGGGGSHVGEVHA